MSNRLADLFDQPPSTLRVQQIAQLVLGWQGWEEVDLPTLLESIEPVVGPTHRTEGGASQAGLTDRELELIFGRLGQLQTETPVAWSPEWIESLEAIYRAVGSASTARNQILALLASIGSSESMRHWVTALCKDPPEYRATIPLAFAPLLSRPEMLTPPFFEPLLSCAIQHLPVAAAVLDLANFAFREQHLGEHPAQSRAGRLAELLGQLVSRLQRIEEGKLPERETPDQLSRTVNDAVSLIIPLCDALALMDEQAAIGKLRQAMTLKHRRVQVEAAAALARLGDPDGRTTLISLAQHPSIRQRVLAYARELGVLTDISLEWQGEIATAESYLAMWLAEPQQMGLAPTSIRLLDQRNWAWPGYEQPVDCYLFEFHYGENGYANIGISGPLTHAFTTDLRPLDRLDQYAAFAGWQTEHPDIFVLPIDRARQRMPETVQYLEQQLQDSGLAFDQLIALSGFLGDFQLIATAGEDDTVGTWIISADGIEGIPRGNLNAPIEWPLALDIWKGRNLLRQFNPSEFAE